jgi:hypothetical protein
MAISDTLPEGSRDKFVQRVITNLSAVQNAIRIKRADLAEQALSILLTIGLT